VLGGVLSGVAFFISSISAPCSYRHPRLGMLGTDSSEA
jgi:hypothetical protein